MFQINWCKAFPIVIHLGMVVFILPGMIREMDLLLDPQLYGLVL
jgi:cytochrome c biogenesis protein ResB